MAPAGVKHDDDKGMGEVVSDLWQLCRDYAKQELVDPLASIKRFLALGFGGAVLLSFGVFFLALALLRALQNETGDALTGVLDWVPYAATLAFTALVAGLAAFAIKKPVRAEERDHP